MIRILLNNSNRLNLFLLFLCGLILFELFACTPSNVVKPTVAPKITYPIEQKNISIVSPWSFMIDQTSIGIEEEWFQPEFDVTTWQLVNVPHTWNVMSEYSTYEGEAWYRYDFLAISETKNAHSVLRFEGVYYKAEVWFNGNFLGKHEGGYTPFEFDVSDFIRSDGKNTIAVKVDNTRRFDRVPDDVFDWYPYGGIVRGVSLKTTSEVFVQMQRITAIPNIIGWNESDNAEVAAEILVTNLSKEEFEGNLKVEIFDEKSGKFAGLNPVIIGVKIPPDESSEIEIKINIDSPRLWHFDFPNLYIWQSSLLDSAGDLFHTESDVFGIRSVELHNNQLVFNGEPVRLVGMTRHADSPDYGLAEPVSFMSADFDDLKRLNTVLSRPVHYPQDESVLDYCDRYGILIIPEIPAWQLESTHLTNPRTLETAKQQFREMVGEAYNHPSVWAWSVGNEFDSHTTQGVNYVKEMVDLAHELDPSRPVSFASNHLWDHQETEASAFADFVMMNEYAGSWHAPKESLPEALDRIHELWPNKVIFISEFGLEAGWTAEEWMGDTTGMNNENYYYIKPGTPSDSSEVFALRAQLINDQMEVFRQRSFVVGAIFWTYQDYRSDMEFRMGLYDFNRNPSPVIDVLRNQYSPIQQVEIIEDNGKISIKFKTRGPVGEDMPVYTLRGYKLTWQIISKENGLILSEGEEHLPVLAPAEIWQGEINTELPTIDYEVKVSILRPTGFSVGEYTLEK